MTREKVLGNEGTKSDGPRGSSTIAFTSWTLDDEGGQVPPVRDVMARFEEAGASFASLDCSTSVFASGSSPFDGGRTVLLLAFDDRSIRLDVTVIDDPVETVPGEPLPALRIDPSCTPDRLGP